MTLFQINVLFYGPWKHQNLCWKYCFEKKTRITTTSRSFKDWLLQKLWWVMETFMSYVTKLSLLSYWKINCSNTVHFFKTDPMYENTVLDIFVTDTFNFTIQVSGRCLPTDYEIYKNYNSSVNNIRVSNLVKMLSNNRVCEGIKNQQVL